MIKTNLRTVKVNGRSASGSVADMRGNALFHNVTNAPRGSRKRRKQLAKYFDTEFGYSGDADNPVYNQTNKRFKRGQRLAKKMKNVESDTLIAVKAVIKESKRRK